MPLSQHMSVRARRFDIKDFTPIYAPYLHLISLRTNHHTCCMPLPQHMSLLRGGLACPLVLPDVATASCLPTYSRSMERPIYGVPPNS